MDIKNTVALVTGAGSGLGLATCKALVEAGAQVVAVDLDEERLVREMAPLGERVHTLKVDVADDASVAAAVAFAVDTFGGLHVAVNCAGILGPCKTLSKGELFPLDLWNRVIGVNLTGTFKMTRAALRVFLANGGGSIVNTASSAAYRATAYGAAYGASKAGVIGFTQTIAIEYGRHNVRCNAVAPAGVKTGMTRGIEFPDGIDFSLLERIMAFDGELDPDDLAQTYVFLGSPASDRINGETISVDDGMLA